MSGEGASIAMPTAELLPAANPARVEDLRQLVDQLRTAGIGSIDAKTARLAANELATLADALEAGGAVANGYAVVPLLDCEPQPAPIGPPETGQ